MTITCRVNGVEIRDCLISSAAVRCLHVRHWLDLGIVFGALRSSDVQWLYSGYSPRFFESCGQKLACCEVHASCSACC